MATSKSTGWSGVFPLRPNALAFQFTPQAGLLLLAGHRPGRLIRLTGERMPAVALDNWDSRCRERFGRGCSSQRRQVGFQPDLPVGRDHPAAGLLREDDLFALVE